MKTSTSYQRVEISKMTSTSLPCKGKLFDQDKQYFRNKLLNVNKKEEICTLFLR